MDSYKIVDLEKWSGRNQYKLYTQQWGGVYFTASKKLDVTATVQYLKERKIKFVAAVIWIFGNALNSRENFRMEKREEGLALWDSIHPVYPVLNADESFCFHSTRYSESFSEFYKNYIEEQEENAGKTDSIFVGDIPQNQFVVSVLPYIDFESVTFSIRARDYFTPIVEAGKYTGSDKKLMAVSLTINHAIADGKAMAAFFDRAQYLLDNPELWCRG